MSEVSDAGGRRIGKSTWRPGHGYIPGVLPLSCEDLAVLRTVRAQLVAARVIPGEGEDTSAFVRRTPAQESQAFLDALSNAVAGARDEYPGTSVDPHLEGMSTLLDSLSQQGGVIPQMGRDVLFEAFTEEGMTDDGRGPGSVSGGRSR